MEIGIQLPTMLAGFDRDALLAWCRRIDEGPFSTLGAGERMAFPNPDLFVTMSAAAVATVRVRLALTVVVLPMHPAVAVAKQAATLDVFSAGRLVLGVGVGGRAEDYRARETSFSGLHARMDEQVAVMRRVWEGIAPFDGVGPVGPAPIQPGGPPLWAGVLGPKAMARAARWADGVVGFLLDPLAVDAGAPIAAATAAWQAAGRSEAPRHVTTLWYALGPGGAERARDFGMRYLGSFGESEARSMVDRLSATSLDSLARALDHLEAAGYDEVMLVPTSGDLRELDAVDALIESR